MNHIIHSCTHSHVAKDRPEGLSRQPQLGGMAACLESLLDLLEPRCTGFNITMGQVLAGFCIIM